MADRPKIEKSRHGVDPFLGARSLQGKLASAHVSGGAIYVKCLKHGFCGAEDFYKTFLRERPASTTDHGNNATAFFIVSVVLFLLSWICHLVFGALT